MDKTQVIKLRDSFGKDNLKVICDNEQLFVTGGEGVFVLWDDDNEILYRCATSNNYYQQKEKPIEVLATAYEQIQYIGKALSVEDYNAVLDRVSDNDLFTKEETKPSRDYYNQKYNYKK